MRERIARFMAGRNGTDELARFGLAVSMILLLLGIIGGATIFGSICYYLGVGVLVWCYFRIFSRNLEKRRMENYRYLVLRGKAIAPFRNHIVHFQQRGSYKFYRCPGCRAELRVPKGKGRISIRCPKCGQRFEKHT